MCTLVAWLSVFPEAPLVVAANRDERLGRPSRGPEKHRDYVAPVDLVAGGTWWAINRHGLFVGITNRAGAMRSDDRRSRGLLVADLAEFESVEDAEVYLTFLNPRVYNGFHLLVTDGTRGSVSVWDGKVFSGTDIGPGMHVLTERGFGAEPVERELRVRALASSISARPLDCDAIAEMLRTHVEPAIESLCVHVPELDYGTRSSTIYLRRADGSEELRFAPGPPCVTPFEDVSALLDG